MKTTKSLEELLAGVNTSYLTEGEKATLIARAQSTEYTMNLIFSAAASMKKAVTKLFASKAKHAQHA